MLQITSRLKSRNGRTRREWLDNEKLLLGLRMEGNLSVAQNETGATESVLKENSTCRSHVIFPQFPQGLADAHGVGSVGRAKRCGNTPWHPEPEGYIGRALDGLSFLSSWLSHVMFLT